ncbi:hypothetical protein [Halorubellus salinus]|uniref:hypothetical protein n=1 Tax=Halorubellus salinus TaxID=755309 RepID=UPI003F63BE01
MAEPEPTEPTDTESEPTDPERESVEAEPESVEDGPATSDDHDGDRDDAHLRDVEPGAGCTEIWEHLSETRDD